MVTCDSSSCGICVCSTVSGWLADAKFGNYKVFRIGVVLLFIATVINCSILVLEELLWESNHTLKWVHFLLCGTLGAVGSCACITALPLGLDQMPDASASSIASYIACMVCLQCSCWRISSSKTIPT